MQDTNIQLKWEEGAKTKYDTMVENIPLFHREIAKTVVNKKAEILARDRGASQVEEEDIVRAFFTEVPMTFYSLMIRLLDQAGFDYKKYQEEV